jgi:hypothetical protein
MNRLRLGSKGRKTSGAIIHGMVLTTVLSLFAIVGVTVGQGTTCDGKPVGCDLGTDTCLNQGDYCMQLKSQYKSQSAACTTNTVIQDSQDCGKMYQRPAGATSHIATNCTQDGGQCGSPQVDTSCTAQSN